MCIASKQTFPEEHVHSEQNEFLIFFLESSLDGRDCNRSTGNQVETRIKIARCSMNLFGCGSHGVTVLLLHFSLLKMRP